MNGCFCTILTLLMSSVVVFLFVGFEQISHITLVLLVDFEQVNTGWYVNGNNQRITLETFLVIDL